MRQYSFKDLSIAISDPDAGNFSAAGKIGIGSITVLNSTERTAHAVAADGAVMVSYISGDNGQLTIEAQQNSDIHRFFLKAFNTKKIAADNGDPSTWAAMTITMRNLADGTGHLATGVSFAKVPDKPYQAQGQNVTWTLMVADLQNLSA